MKALRHLPALFASCLLLVLTGSRVSADPLTIDWIGAGGTPAATDPDNWSGPADPATPYQPQGDGSENFRFGELPATSTSVYLPVILDEGDEPVPVAVKDLIFSNVAADGFNFSFSGNSSEDSGLYLHGNVTLAAGGTATIADSMAFLLTHTSHSVTVGNNSSLVVDAPIFEYSEEEGHASIDKWGTGTLTLNSSYSDFAGGLNLHEGILRIGADSKLEELPPGGPVGLGTLALNADTTLGLSDEGSYTLANTIDLGTFDDGAATIDTGSGDLILAGTISGSGDIVKTGSGSLTIAPALGYNNLYEGNTSVEGGTLVLTGSTPLGYGNITVNNATVLLQNASASNQITVNSGGTLSGSGYVYETIVHAGGTLQVGSFYCPVETLWMNELTLEGMSTVAFGVKSDGEGGVSNGAIYVENPATLTLSGIDSDHRLTLRVISEGVLTGLAAGETYYLDFLFFQSQAGGVLSLANVDIDDSAFQLEFEGATFELIANEGSYTLAFTPVPEPSTYALMALGAGLTGLAAWRKRRRA